LPNIYSSIELHFSQFLRLWFAGLAPLQHAGGMDRHGRGPTQRALAAERAKREVIDMQKANQCRCPNVSSTFTAHWWKLCCSLCGRQISYLMLLSHPRWHLYDCTSSCFWSRQCLLHWPTSTERCLFILSFFFESQCWTININAL